MPIDPSAVGASPVPTEGYWTSKDCLLYALGVGAGTADLRVHDGEQRRHHPEGPPDVRVCRRGPGADPVAGASGFSRVGSYDPTMMVHGEQGITLHRPLPTDAEFVSTGTITGIYDKGSGAVIASESTHGREGHRRPAVHDPDGAVRPGRGRIRRRPGPGGGEARSQPARRSRRDLPDAARPGPALPAVGGPQPAPRRSRPSPSGAGSPADPPRSVHASGSPAGRLLHALCDDDPTRFLSMDARFSKPVFPGDDLTVSIWVEGDRALFRTERAPGEVVHRQRGVHLQSLTQ